jgi:hypothetical protein
MELSEIFTFTNIFRIVIPGVLFLIGGVMLLMSIRVWLKTLSARSWQTTSAVITESAVIESEDDGAMYYHPEIKYQYEVGGRSFSSSQYALGSKITWGGQGRDRRKADTLVQRYPTGQRVQVYYNPRNPEDAVLEIRSANTGTLVGVGLVLIVIGAGIVTGINWLASQ